MNANFRGKGASPPMIFGTRKVESLSYRMVKKKLPKSSTAWVGCTNVTDRRQTTDGRLIAYSERNAVRSLKMMLMVIIIIIIIIITMASFQRILTTGRIIGANCFTGETLMWHRPVGSQAVDSRSRTDAVNFCCVHRSTDSQCFFSMGQKLSLFVEGSGSLSNTWFLGPTRVYCPVDRFTHFCRAQERDQQTDTISATPSVVTGHI